MWSFLIENLIKSAGILGLALVLIPSLSYIEFRSLTFAQRRSGSNGVKSWGPLGFWADIIKLLSKNTQLATSSHLLPAFSLLLSSLPLVVFPLCEPFLVGGEDMSTAIIQGPYSLLVLWVLFSLSQWGPILVFWTGKGSSARRATYRQLSSFINGEVVLAILLANLIFHFNTGNINNLAQAQIGSTYWNLPAWGLFSQPLAFLIFGTLISLKNMTFPFENFSYHNDIPGANLDSLGFLLGRLAWHIQKLIGALMITFLFMGGYALFPGLEALVEKFPSSIYTLQFLSLIFKLVLVLTIGSWLRHAYSKIHTEWSSRIYWRVLLPLSFINFLITISLNYWDIF